MQPVSVMWHSVHVGMLAHFDPPTSNISKHYIVFLAVAHASYLEDFCKNALMPYKASDYFPHVHGLLQVSVV